MLSAPGTKDLTLKMYGLSHMSGKVLLDVFVRKQQVLLKGLRRIDKARNGGVRFDYIVEHLEIGSAVIAIHEKRTSDKPAHFSPSKELIDIGRRLSLGSRTDNPHYAAALETYENLCSRVGDRFDHGTLTGIKAENVVRIDKFLQRKVITQRAHIDAEKVGEKLTHFAGSAWGAFDGRLQEIDLRAVDTRTGYFVLTAGGVEVPCVLYVDIEDIRDIFDHRVIVEGDAIYNGKSAIPERLEIRSIRRIEGRGLLRWAQSFDDWHLPEWSSEAN